MKIIELITPPQYRPARAMEPTTVTVHNTANPNAGAERHALSQAAGSLARLTIAVHYYVDDKAIYRCIPENMQGWHAGDGSKQGGGNATSIAIEVCEHKGIDQRKAFVNAAALVAEIRARYGWGTDKVKKHMDWKSTKYPKGKYCPHILLDGVNGMSWEWFIGLTNKEEKVMYKTIADVPDWGKATIQKLMNESLLVGNAKGELNLSEDMVRLLVINDRAGLYDLEV